MTPRTILLIDDDSDFLAVLRKRCQGLGLDVMQARNLLTAFARIEKRLPDLICLDVQMPTGSGLQFCRQLRVDLRTAATPIVILTGSQSQDVQIACRKMGAHFVHKSCGFWRELEQTLKQVIAELPASPLAIDNREGLLEAVFSMLGSEANSVNPDAKSDHETVDQLYDGPGSILCIEDDVDFFDGVSIRLRELGYSTIQARDGMSGFRSAFVSPIRAILLDYMLPNGRGDYILTRLQDNLVTKDIPVIVVTGQCDKMLERRMLAMGATAYLTKPIDMCALQETLSTCLSA